MNDTIQSLRKQLSEAKENLRLIQERKSQYVLDTDIPLQLVKEERRLEERVAELQARMDAPISGEEGEVEPSNTKVWVVVTLAVAVIGACAVTIAALIGIIPDVFPPSPTVPLTPVNATQIPEPPREDTPDSSVIPLVPLTIRDLWPVGTECHPAGAWSAHLWVQPEGGDGVYEYYIDGDWKAGPTIEGVKIHLYSSSCTSIVGTVTVESGGQIESREFFIDVPDCCGQ